MTAALILLWVFDVSLVVIILKTASHGRKT